MAAVYRRLSKVIRPIGDDDAVRRSANRIFRQTDARREDPYGDVGGRSESGDDQCCPIQYGHAIKVGRKIGDIGLMRQHRDITEG